jgi:hypothetical protein
MVSHECVTQHYRPISLLCVGYKVCAALVHHRLAAGGGKCMHGEMVDREEANDAIDTSAMIAGLRPIGLLQHVLGRAVLSQPSSSLLMSGLLQGAFALLPPIDQDSLREKVCWNIVVCRRHSALWRNR